MRVRKVKRLAPCSGSGDGVDPEGQRFEVYANLLPLVPGEPSTVGRDEEHIGYLDGPEGRHERSPFD